MDRWRIGRLVILAGGLGMVLGAVLAGVDEDAHRDQPGDAIDFLGRSSEVAVWLSLVVVGLAVWHFRAWGLGKLVVVGLVATGSVVFTLRGDGDPLWDQGFEGVELVARWVVVVSASVVLVGVLWSFVELPRSARRRAVDVTASLAWWRKWGLAVAAGFVALLVLWQVRQAFDPSEEATPTETSDEADQGFEGGVQDDWSISADGDAPGSYIFSMIKTFSPLEEADVEDLGGRFVWPETELELCDVNIWAGDGFVQIGTVSPTTEGCPGMLEAFVDFGLPETACVFVRSNGIDDEYCAPLAVE